MSVSDVRLQSRWTQTRGSGRNRERQREDSCGAYCTSTSGTLKWRARGSLSLGMKHPNITHLDDAEDDKEQKDDFCERG